jgi:hypothetical protein
MEPGVEPAAARVVKEEFAAEYVAHLRDEVKSGEPGLISHRAPPLCGCRARRSTC